MTTNIQIRTTPGAKMMFMIRRRAGVSREELIAHWFANHMPGVIERMALQASAGRPAARRYIATLFDPTPESQWDGVAQLWFDEPLPVPKEAHGTQPADSFQERAEPYLPWATTEHVVLGGELPVTPLTLNPPFPTTRSGFLKLTSLVTAKPGVNHDAMYRQWLDVHAPTAAAVIEKHGGFRYVVSLSLDPANAPYTAMAELYFDNADAWQACAAELTPDGMEAYIERTEFLTAGTEMVGIP